MSTWRDLHRQLPQFTYVSDIEAYADVFDAIDAARRRGRGYVPGPDEGKRLTEVLVTDADGNARLADLVVSVMPVLPVRTANTLRLCVGLLQDAVWRDTERWYLRVQAPPGSDVLLPSVCSLLARKLQPTPGEIADVARFLFWPSFGFGEGRECYGEVCMPVFRFIEKHVVPPAGEPIRASLTEARRRLGMVKSEALKVRHKSGGKPQTSRFDKWDARLVRLLDGP